MRAALALALRPLRHFADCSGRSRRLELLAWHLTMSFAGLLLLRFVPEEGEQAASTALTYALLCPTLALFVRRLHDSGRSGYWLLLLAPALVANAYRHWRIIGEDMTPTAAASLPWEVGLPVALAGLAGFVLLLWNDDPADNRYGPNPRLDAPAA